MAFLVAQMVKRLPANVEDPVSIPGLVRSPGGGNGKALQKIPWTEEPGPWGRKGSDTTERLHFSH